MQGTENATSSLWSSQWTSGWSVSEWTCPTSKASAARKERVALVLPVDCPTPCWNRSNRTEKNMKGGCTHETSRNLGSIGKAVHTLSWFPPNKSRFFATVPLCAEYLAGCAAVKFMDRTWSPGWHSILQLIPPIFCRSWSSKSRKFKDVIFAKPMSWHTCQQ